MKPRNPYLLIMRDIIVSPFTFFRRMPLTEGVKTATYYALIIYVIKSAVFFFMSWRQGFFFSEEFRAIPPVTIGSGIFLAMVPFLLLLILYAQSVFLFRIANFFGGIANLEAAYKILAYCLIFSLLQFVPIVNIAAKVYGICIIIIGIREVFNIDYLSAALSLLFSFLFTTVLYIILLIIPMYFFHFFMMTASPF